MDSTEISKEGQVQLQIEYGSQHGQVQVNVLEINGLILPAVKRLGISHVYVKSHLLSEKTKELMKSKSTMMGYFLPDASKETKRKTEEVKLTLSCHHATNNFENKSDEKSRKSKIRKALQKQRERFRLRRNSDKVKTVVNASGEEDGRATLSFERSLYYPSVSLYQLQTQCLHLTICGRNVTTTRSFPIATTYVPLIIAIKQHQPTWYPLSYNPDLMSGKQESNMTIQDSWDKEGETYTGRSVAWNREENEDTSPGDNWIYKRKDYARHRELKQRRQPTTKTSLHSHTSGQNISARFRRTNGDYPSAFRRPSDDYTSSFRRPSDEYTSAFRRPAEPKRNELDSGVGLDRLGTRPDSIEELYFEDNSEKHRGYSQAKGFNKSQKKWKSEFVIRGSTLETKRSSNATNLDLSSLSLNRKTFGEGIRGF